ncbi:ABC transporter permease subunit [Clostridiaceae bacterium DONG20-135]|uniref:ABC transporter permease subunit n=1 Tax=Copranaerobaculum intestinale TaxID=2692629 RepID=A0A6N8U6L3_9FIRM|nr:ABC transporter permease subunit [Copranaerobaculum intestinale]MXQ73165.1 ABC transporter permease subunit [Copranaerobaculum intestinale]
MEKNKKTARFFSKPLMRQTIKSNWILCVAIMMIMVLLANVMNYAMSMMATERSDVDVTEYQESFYTYLGSLATYDTMTKQELSYQDFATGKNDAAYETAFAMMNAKTNMKLSVKGFQDSIDGLSQSGIRIDKYVKQFEYAYALKESEGVFDKKALTPSGMLTITLDMMGVSSEMVEKMSEMDPASMMNQMYYTAMGLLPIFILIVILANSLIADQVDRGSMAYVLSTPTKRSAVAITQLVFIIVVPFLILSVVCATRIGTSFLFYDKVNVAGMLALFGGMYILVEAVCGLCYMGSCLFSQSKKSMAFGGGLTVWFFLASMIGLFGSENMVNTGMGVSELSIFNKLTLVGLYDVNSLSTIGTGSIDFTFAWKLLILVGIAAACYTVGVIKFSKKDLPL